MVPVVDDGVFLVRARDLHMIRHDTVNPVPIWNGSRLTELVETAKHRVSPSWQETLS